MGKIDEAEQFLRQGLRANPDSYQILYELGRLLYENRHDPVRAGNIWMQALRRWRESQQGLKEPDEGALERIAGDLAKLEEGEGHYAEAIKWFELTRLHSPNPDQVQKRIDSLRLKLAAPEH
jgi:tetratricopeptide (TPR) repeat protein